MPDVFAAIKALIVREGRFLALELEVGRKKIWDLPGGKVEHGEDPIEALKREAWEEAGLKVEALEAVGVYYFMRLSDGAMVVNTVFRCDAGTQKPVLPHKENERIAQMKWFSKEEFMAKGVDAPKSLKELIGKSL
ncbi:MAG: NUDIX hydrolase [Candidatus Diapherotrites archaeon]|uniref:NUDIX hydrolase n=1 Tax=Candidatus Iainarchaeum sp. TaxID=3101447 RepID=A0A939C7D8_9ARCH|nr:NUDIX hydrolase [Candidatus Diapherotrites archaeon]